MKARLSLFSWWCTVYLTRLRHWSHPNINYISNGPAAPHKPHQGFLHWQEHILKKRQKGPCWRDHYKRLSSSSSMRALWQWDLFHHLFFTTKSFTPFFHHHLLKTPQAQRMGIESQGRTPYKSSSEVVPLMIPQSCCCFGWVSPETFQNWRPLLL